MHAHSYSSLPLWLIAAALVLGCLQRREPDYSVLNLAEVTGVVTMNGEPLSDAKLLFEETETKARRTCYALTDSRGAYRVHRERHVPGCLPGKLVVRITSQQDASVEDADALPDARIPAKYNRKSDLVVEVEPNGQHEFDFDLLAP